MIQENSLNNSMLCMKEIFKKGGEDLPEIFYPVLDVFIKELMLWNRHFNLTGFKTIEEIVEFGIYPVIKLRKYFREKERVIDVGSGGGIPGLIIAAICPDSFFTLVEPLRKKTSFLRMGAVKMGVKNVKIISVKVEELIGKEYYDSAISMAVFPPLKWLELGKLLVKQEGRIFVLHAGRLIPRIGISDVELISNEEFLLPQAKRKRGIAVFVRKK